MSKPRPTTFDYVVAALNPALIMLMEASLAFFLLNVLYQGNHSARLYFIFGCFIAGIVLVARISIEQGRERATLFAIPLGIVSLIAINRFVEFEGLWSQLNVILNMGLMALIWWTANKLTWDCTVIDESEEAMSQGLTQSLGLDESESAAVDRNETAHSAADDSVQDSNRPAFAWWRRLTSTTKKPHPHGVWIIYFSLAALPIFGIGHAFLRKDAVGGSSGAIGLLVSYLLGALLLLVTTSLIGLRKYLRRRRLEMPVNITASWLLLGCTLSTLVLVSVLLLPRSIGDFSLSELPWSTKSADELATSSLGQGSSDQHSNDPAKQQSSSTDKQAQGKGRTTKSSKDKSNSSRDGDKDQRGSKGGDDKGGKDKSRQDSDGKSSGDKSRANSNSPDEHEASHQKDGKNSKSKSNANEPADKAERKDPNEQSSNDDQRQSERGQQDSDSDSSANQKNAQQSLQEIVRMFGRILKWCIWIALFVVATFFGWKYRHELMAALKELLQDLRMLLAANVR